MTKEIIECFMALANSERAKVSQRFFKTGTGQYAFGDRFLGISVPEIRNQLKKFRDVNLIVIADLLRNPWHEIRTLALLMLVERYEKDVSQRLLIFELYLGSTTWINNWDLVDLSAEHIVGAWVYENEVDGQRLMHLSQSNYLWERRIAIISTFYMIKKGKFQKTFEIAHTLLNDSHDLIQKAVGWMLREVGKRIDSNQLRIFLKQNAPLMPRTMLRYAIEHFDREERNKWLKYKP